MNIPVAAVYRDGVLYLEERLPFSNDTKVTIIISKVMSPEETLAERERLHSLLVTAGIVKPGPVPMPAGSLLSPEREEELAELFGEGGPVSDLIIEGRDEE